jgi:hypothetical protein
MSTIWKAAVATPKKVQSGRTRLGFLPSGAHEAFVGHYRDRGRNDLVERIPTLAFDPGSLLAVLDAQPGAHAGFEELATIRLLALQRRKR